MFIDEDRDRRYGIGHGLGALASAKAAGADNSIVRSNAITQVFGDGQRLVAAIVAFDRAPDSSQLSPSAFDVDGRTVAKVCANTATATADKRVNGKYAIVALFSDNMDVLLYVMGRGPGVAPTRKPPKAVVVQTGPITTSDGGVIVPVGQPVTTDKVANLVVEDFKRFEFKDATTGDTLNYNLFVPKSYDKSKSYPLVLFIHDAGVTSRDPMMTLVQGLGAISFASSSDTWSMRPSS